MEIRELNDDVMAQAAGGSDPRNDPHYNEIKEYYKAHGYRLAIILGTYYGIKNLYEMMALITEEVG